MSNLPNAEMSPRIVNGVLKWYQGDTFDLSIELSLTDQDGAPKEISASDSVKIVFLDSGLNTVKEFNFTGIQDNTVTLDFDSVCTALFPKGRYTYDVYYTSQERTTVANDNKVVVE